METFLRLCSYCGCLKPFNPSAPENRKARGFAGARCWDCKLKNQLVPMAKWRAENPDKAAAAKNAWYMANPGKHRELNNTWYAANPGKRTELSQQYNMRKAQRTPPWANLDKISEIYRKAALKGLAVDHIVPITHPLVSGLHVEYNLQLLTKSENSIKSNKFEAA